jgi:hypothetical protein
MVPEEVLTSDACRHLPHYAFRTLVAIAAAYNGLNNGDLSIPLKRARDHGLSEWQLYAGLDLLQRVGLILKTRQGGKHPMGCSLYALQFRDIDESSKYDAGITHGLPPNRWAKWQVPSAWRAEVKAVEDRVRGRGSRERARARWETKAHSSRGGDDASTAAGTADSFPVPPVGETEHGDPVPPVARTSKTLGVLPTMPATEGGL